MNRYHKNALDHGWWDYCLDTNTADGLNHEKVVRAIPEKLVLIHSEVSEALEDYREGRLHLAYDGDGILGHPHKPVGFPSELADIVIRTYDLAGALGIDLNEVIEIKHKHNVQRPFRHGGKRC